MAKSERELWYVNLTRAIHDRCLAIEHGTQAVVVMHAVMIRQYDLTCHDSVVPISNFEIMSKSNVLNEETFRSIRRQLVESGWLTYICHGTRRPGMYAAHLPGESFCESRFSVDQETDTRKRKGMSPKKRFAVLQKSNFSCVYCGRKPPDVELQVDHVKAFSKDGSDDDENLVAACQDCNYGKGCTDAHRNA